MAMSLIGIQIFAFFIFSKPIEMNQWGLIRTASWIQKHLVLCSSTHMTPEIKLRLLTPQCPLWTSQPDHCPFPDPYWAFYWPGGQVLTRYILDTPELVRNKKVIDFGSGCGASAIAARLCGAKWVMVNDIDKVALTASALNAKLNGLRTSDLHYESTDLINSHSNPDCHVISVGDVCYDSEFSLKLLAWLKGQVSTWNTRVIIGDPGRPALLDSSYSTHLVPLARYPLPENITQEHYGYSVGCVYELK